MDVGDYLTVTITEKAQQMVDITFQLENEQWIREFGGPDKNDAVKILCIEFLSLNDLAHQRDTQASSVFLREWKLYVRDWEKGSRST